MLLKYQQMKYLKVADQDSYRFEDNGKATKEEKQELKELDEAYVFINGKHMIVNYEQLL